LHSAWTASHLSRHADHRSSNWWRTPVPEGQQAVRNRQVGPDEATDVLAQLVPRITYKPGWTFKLEEISRGQGCEGLTLLISATVPDTCTPGEETTFVHLMEVPAANYNERNWRRWILEQIL
jgi:hypothetical protein